MTTHKWWIYPAVWWLHHAWDTLPRGDGWGFEVSRWNQEKTINTIIYITPNEFAYQSRLEANLAMQGVMHALAEYTEIETRRPALTDWGYPKVPTTEVGHAQWLKACEQELAIDEG